VSPFGLKKFLLLTWIELFEVWDKFLWIGDLRLMLRNLPFQRGNAFLKFCWRFSSIIFQETSMPSTFPGNLQWRLRNLLYFIFAPGVYKSIQRLQFAYRLN